MIIITIYVGGPIRVTFCVRVYIKPSSECGIVVSCPEVVKRELFSSDSLVLQFFAAEQVTVQVRIRAEECQSQRIIVVRLHRLHFPVRFVAQHPNATYVILFGIVIYKTARGLFRQPFRLYYMVQLVVAVHQVSPIKSKRASYLCCQFLSC